MSHRKPEEAAENAGAGRSRRALLYAASILIALILIVSATGHVVSLRPAALLGFPVMIIAGTALLLLIFYLLGPDLQSGAADPVAAAVEHALLAAVAIEPQTGRILAANEAAIELMGPTRVAPGGRFADLLPEEAYEESERILRNTRQCGEYVTRVHSRCTQPNGAGIVRITARLVEMNDSAFILVGLSGNTVDDAVAQFALVQERLMSNISHELRTPLNVVMGFSELLITGTLGEMPDNQLDAAEECHEGGERMLRLINDILDVGRSRSYYLETETAPLAPAEMVHRMANLLSGQARREELRLELDLDPSLPVIESEERAFKQLIYHLILHSMSRSAPGGTVRIVAGHDEEHVVLSVSDSGREVPEDIQPQPVSLLSECDGGEALAPPLVGLTLCATLAEKLGASLSAERDEDGAHFVIRRPLPRA